MDLTRYDKKIKVLLSVTILILICNLIGAYINSDKLMTSEYVFVALLGVF